MRPTSSLPKRSSNKAAALIIVLAFVVLLTGLAVAYLSRATTDRQLAHTSFHDTDADLLARSALDIVVGDFKQEIVKGSNCQATVFIPTLPANVVPMYNADADAGHNAGYSKFHSTYRPFGVLLVARFCYRSGRREPSLGSEFHNRSLCKRTID